MSAVGCDKMSVATHVVKVNVTVFPGADVWAAGRAPQPVTCKTSSVSALDVLEASPLEFASGVYVATSGVFPEAGACVMVNAHEPVPAEADVSVAKH